MQTMMIPYDEQEINNAIAHVTTSQSIRMAMALVKSTNSRYIYPFPLPVLSLVLSYSLPFGAIAASFEYHQHKLILAVTNGPPITSNGVINQTVTGLLSSSSSLKKEKKNTKKEDLTRLPPPNPNIKLYALLAFRYWRLSIRYDANYYEAVATNEQEPNISKRKAGTILIDDESDKNHDDYYYRYVTNSDINDSFNNYALYDRPPLKNKSQKDNEYVCYAYYRLAIYARYGLHVDSKVIESTATKKWLRRALRFRKSLTPTAWSWFFCYAPVNWLSCAAREYKHHYTGSEFIAKLIAYHDRIAARHTIGEQRKIPTSLPLRHGVSKNIQDQSRYHIEFYSSYYHAMHHGDIRLIHSLLQQMIPTTNNSAQVSPLSGSGSFHRLTALRRVNHLIVTMLRVLYGVCHPIVKRYGDIPGCDVISKSVTSSSSSSSSSSCLKSTMISLNYLSRPTDVLLDNHWLNHEQETRTLSSSSSYASLAPENIDNDNCDMKRTHMLAAYGNMESKLLGPGHRRRHRHGHGRGRKKKGHTDKQRLVCAVNKAMCEIHNIETREHTSMMDAISNAGFDNGVVSPLCYRPTSSVLLSLPDIIKAAACTSIRDIIKLLDKLIFDYQALDVASKYQSCDHHCLTFEIYLTYIWLYGSTAVVRPWKNDDDDDDDDDDDGNDKDGAKFLLYPHTNHQGPCRFESE